MTVRRSSPALLVRAAAPGRLRGRATGVAVLCAVLACGGPALAQDHRDGTDPVRVSGPSPFPQEGCSPTGSSDAAEHGREQDLSLVVDPRDPTRLAAAWVQDAALGFVVARSSDGGDTWERSVVPGVTRCTGGPAEHVTHARLSVGPDGRLWLSGETLDGFFGTVPDPRSGVNRIPVLTSTDFGRTWSVPSYVDDAPVFNGFGTLAAEPDVPGAAVVAWHTPEPVATSYVSRSTDGGRTWTRSVVPGGPVDSLPWHRVVAAGRGVLLLLTVEGTLGGGLQTGFTGTAPLVVRRSTDHGRTWSPPVRLAAAVPTRWVAAAAGPRDRVHVAWHDTAAACGTRLITRSSTDGGLTWGAPVVGPCGIVGPASDLAVTPDGTAGIPLTVAAGEQGRQVLVSSSDDGATWQVGALSDPFPLPNAGGFYVGAAASPRGFVSLFLQGAQGDDRATDAFLARSPGR